MTNELISSYVGKVCMISTGTFGTSIKGKIINIQDNWMELLTRKGKQLCNCDFITNIIEIK